MSRGRRDTAAKEAEAGMSDVPFAVMRSISIIHTISFDEPGPRNRAFFFTLHHQIIGVRVYNFPLI